MITNCGGGSGYQLSSHIDIGIIIIIFRVKTRGFWDIQENEWLDLLIFRWQVMLGFEEGFSSASLSEKSAWDKAGCK